MKALRMGFAPFVLLAYMLTAPAQAQVLSDQQLIDRGKTAYDSRDHVQALRLIFAYQQRSPSLMTNDSDFAEGVAGDLRQAKEVHEQQQLQGRQLDFDPASLANTLLALAQGSMLLSKTSGDRGVLEANLKNFRQYLELLFER